MARPVMTSATGMPLTAAKVGAPARATGTDAAWMIASRVEGAVCSRIDSMFTQAFSTQTTTVFQGLKNLEAKMDFVMSLMESIVVAQGLTDEEGLSLLYEKQWMPNGCTAFKAHGNAKKELTPVHKPAASDSETSASSRVSTVLGDDTATGSTRIGLSSSDEDREKPLTKTPIAKKDTKKSKLRKEDAAGIDHGRCLQERVDKLEKLLKESIGNEKRQVVMVEKHNVDDALQLQDQEHLQGRVDYLEQLSEELLGDSADLHAQWERMTGRDEQLHELQERMQYLEALLVDGSVCDYEESAGVFPSESVQHEEAERVD